VTLDSVLHYEIAGAGAPVVLLHAGALDSRTWDAQFEALARQHTVIRCDLRGHGRSPTPTKPFAHYEDLRALLDELGIARAALVGLSLGSRTAIDFALSYPDRVDRLVLAAPGISGMTMRDPFILSQLGKLAEAVAAGDLEAALESVVRMWVDGPYRAPEEVPASVRAFCKEMFRDTVTRHGQTGHTLTTELNAVERTAELRAPILLPVGDVDSSDIHDVVDLVAGKAHDASKVVLPGAGHNVNLEAPGEFNRIVLEFLSRPS
jgi:pimeloyl-ACP methyl ester carboxylesterase